MTEQQHAEIHACLGYRDAKAAIRWLSEAFGFEARMVSPGEDGREIAHAELALGRAVLIVGSVRVDALRDVGPVDFARIPFSIYVAIDDVDAHCERARAAGAEIVREPNDTEYGSREYTARDLEGNVWSFGTYRPSAGSAPPAASEPIILRAGDGRSYDAGPMHAVFKADGAETDDRYCVSEWWLEAGQPGPGPHSHEANEELFYVVEGTMSFLVGADWVEAPRGSFLRIPAGITHDFENRSDARAGVLNVFIPGGFEPHMPRIVASMS
jgi:uncharacterized glyoxalase superfamily protein PhnB/quercetin dioxygenase-like cupin family protein